MNKVSKSTDVHRGGKIAATIKKRKPTATLPRHDEL